MDISLCSVDSPVEPVPCTKYRRGGAQRSGIGIAVHVCESRALNSGLCFARLPWRDGKVSRLRDLRLVWYGGAGHGAGIHRMGDGGWVKFTLQSAFALLCVAVQCGALRCVAFTLLYSTSHWSALHCVCLSTLYTPQVRPD